MTYNPARILGFFGVGGIAVAFLVGLGLVMPA